MESDDKLTNEIQNTRYKNIVLYFVPFIYYKSLILAQDERWRRG
jgi:hypothetical protein